MNKSVRLLIYGNVQGVGFRYFVKKNADVLSLNGYVRNLSSEVEVVAEGDEKKLDKFIELCKKGPNAAKVKEVKIFSEKRYGEYKGFQIRL